ncbi:MAG: TRAP transporter substrate-binding protein [Desulfobacterales bacterium]|nr:TRAP transporter substrate-binding protein [Desulfobacterales bacterium]
MRNMMTAMITAFMVAILFGTPCFAGKYTLKAGHGAQQGHPTQFGLLKLAEIVKERSNGELEIKVFADRQLGEEREMVEGLQFGTVDITVVSTGPLGGFVGEINVLDLPFLFKNREHAYGVFDGPIGDELLAKFDKIGIKGAAIWENGWRHLTTKKPVSSPADIKGLKMRTMANEIHIAAFKALGAGPVPMAWGEVYTSLDQGVIDAQENPITVIYTNSLWEVQNYVTLTGHVYGPHVALISKKSLGKLPEKLQKILVEAIKEASSYQRQVSMKIEEEQSKQLLEKGMKINPVDLAPFQEGSRSAYKLFTSKHGDALLNRIISAGGGE